MFMQQIDAESRCASDADELIQYDTWQILVLHRLVNHVGCVRLDTDLDTCNVAGNN